MILLLGANGYVGQAFQNLLRSLDWDFLPISRKDLDYYDPARLSAALRDHGIQFLINAAGYTGKPNVDACEFHKAECLEGNAVLPGRIREACETIGIPWGHVSSGCIYSGRREDGAGFLESDTPNFSFRSNHCSFYSGTKALGEEVLEDARQCYIWRLRIPFDHRDGSRNYLSKIQRYARLLEAENSISHLGDFVASCFACWTRELPYGTYNLTNPGAVTTREVAELIRQHLNPGKSFDFFETESEFMQIAAKTPRSNCVMDTQKAEAAGLPMRPVKEALEDALTNWITDPSN
ncbi:sugar nucleotide-binding protein [Akkermansiaceae bacterium]|nr:sugar nucleotide-binding protein [Akkermansiaceae bacterium]